MFQEQELGFSKCHKILDTRLINFAHNSAMQLNDPSLRKHNFFVFPGGLPITPEQCHVNNIRNGNYMFTAKADGFRINLLFILYYIEGDWRKLCIMIYRDTSCYLLKINAPTDMYDNGGSLFDGELVSTTSGWNHILLFDCYSYKGTNTRSLPLIKRHSHCVKLAESCDNQETDSVIIKSKPYYKLEKSNLETSSAFLNNNHFLEYATDGIILVPTGSNNCLSGRDDTQFKMKLDHTIDLILIQETDDPDKPFYLASYDDSDDSYITKQQIQLDTINVNDVKPIFECIAKRTDGIYTFHPLKPRLDKTHPNSESVVKRTLQTISDNIQIQNLMIK